METKYVEPTFVANGQYLNFKPKDSLKVGKGDEQGEHTIVTKVYAKGLEKEGNYGKYYMCAVKNDSGEQASLLLSPKSHKEFEALGGEGDKLKVWVEKIEIVNPKTKIEQLVPTIFFEKVE